MVKENISRFFPIILLIFHVIGIYLFLNDDNGASLTWMNIVLCGLLLFLSESYFKSAFYVLVFIALGGYLIELIGTKTGYLFGDYWYETVLGWRLFDVPLIIGINWYAIVLSSANVARFVKTPIILQSTLAGVLCVFMDFVIEPIAIQYNFWEWQGNEIPFFNYVTWFAFASLFAYIYLKTSSKLNKTAAWLYVIWILFFGLLNALV
ncbi:carotenoid biosynthesis protein [Crocinitomix sp.]|nr:carotenoid biosynthesis protein [Crocinitomix sp.]